MCDVEVAIDRFQRDKSDPSVIDFSEIKRCQLPHSTQFFQKAEVEEETAAAEAEVRLLKSAAELAAAAKAEAEEWERELLGRSAGSAVGAFAEAPLFFCRSQWMSYIAH